MDKKELTIIVNKTLTARSRNFFEHHLKYFLPLKKKWFGKMENVDFLNVDNLSAEEVGQKVKEWVDYCLKTYE